MAHAKKIEDEKIQLDLNAPLSEIDQKKAQLKAMLGSMRDKDRKMITGKFIFHEIPGGMLEFPFKKYEQDPIEKFSLVDGQTYTIPMGVYKHLNENISYPTYSFRQNEVGLPIMGISENIRRCSFQRTNFSDMEETQPIPSAFPA